MKTRNIYLIVWLMLIACTAQAQLTCEGCAVGTPNPIIAAGGGTYSGNIKLIQDATFTIVGVGYYELTGSIDEVGGTRRLTFVAHGENGVAPKLKLSDNLNYKGETVISGILQKVGFSSDIARSSSLTTIEEESMLAIGSSDTYPGSHCMNKLKFSAKTSRMGIHADATRLSRTLIQQFGGGEVIANDGGTFDILDPITLDDDDYQIIRGKISAESASKFVIGKNLSGRCLSLTRDDRGMYLRVRKNQGNPPIKITGPVSVCLGDIIKLSVFNKDITDGAPGKWTLTDNSGSSVKEEPRVVSYIGKSRVSGGSSEAYFQSINTGTVTAMITLNGCSQPASHTFTVKPLPTITFDPPVHPAVATVVDLQHSPGSTNIGFSSTIPGTMVTWQVSKKHGLEDNARIQLSKDGNTLEDIPVEDIPVEDIPVKDIPVKGAPKLTSIRPEAGPVVYKLTADDGGSADLIFEVRPQYTSEGLTCYGAPNSITVNVAGAEIPADRGLKEMPETTPCEIKFTGPVAVAVCVGDFITLSAASRGITKDTPGEWTLKNNAGSDLIHLTKTSVDVGKSYAKLEGVSAGTVTVVFTVSGCDKPAEYPITVKPLPTITFDPPVHLAVAAGVDLEHNPGSTNIRIVPDIPETMVTWRVSSKVMWGDYAHVKISKDGSTLQDIPWEVDDKLTSTTLETGPLVYKLAANEGSDSELIFDVIPQYTLENGQICFGNPNSITVNVVGAEIQADIGSLTETPETTTLCAGGETNIRVGKEGDGNLYQWYSANADHAVEGNSARLDKDAAATIKDRLMLNKQHSAGVVYYITPSSGYYVGATVRVPIVVSPIPSITTTLDKSSINNNTAVSFELATNIEEAEADKVTYTWTVSENKVGAISESTPAKKILPQTLTHTATADESVIYSFIPAYTQAGVVCTGATATAEVLVRGAIVVIKEVADKTTGDIATDKGISVYPVPAKDQVTISSQYELTGIAIRDMSGKNVMRTEANGYQKSISVSTLPVGLYILEIINSGGVKRIKIIKE